MSFLDIIFKPLLKTLKQPIESFIRLETADSDYALAAEDGSLVSVLRIDGSYQIIGNQEYQRIISDSVVKFGTKFDKPGHAMQVYFARNPDLILDKLKKLLAPNRRAAENIGLEIGDIFNEKEKHLSNYLASEEIYFVLWTRPSALNKSDFAREVERSRKIKWVNAKDAQYPYAGIAGLRTKHENFSDSIRVSLGEVGIKSEMLAVHDALKAIRMNLFQMGVNSNWSPCLPGDPIPPRAPEHRGDMSEILWPSLKYQLASYPAKVINDHVIEMGNYIWGGVDLVLAPQESIPFPALLDRLNENGIPFRISFLIEGGGVQGMAMQSFMTSILAVTNASNRMIRDSIEALTEISRNEPVVKFRASFCTWAPKGQIEELETRISALIQSIESWGYCQASYVTGDPLDCVMSSALGIACASTAPPAIAPLYEVLKLLPWQRGASPFGQGAILFRTPDGRVWPYQTGTNVTTTWFDLVFAQPGGGKSVLMNTLNLGTCLAAGMSDLPFIAVIDIGPSSAGLISLIKDALPAEKRHQAVSYRLQMSQDYAINPFDTKLGMRVPQATERSFLVELLILLCTPAGQKEPYDGIPQLAGMVIDEMYRWRDDNTANAEPRPYLPRISREVDEMLQKHEITVADGAYWWDVVDMLFDKGLTYEASIAQRYAVPTLGDSVAAARRPQIKNLLSETTIGASSEGVIHAFERMVTSAVREFPILSSVTKFALNENRICSLDLADVCPQGDATSDRQTAIMYMLARYALVSPWWINEEALVQMPVRYRPYHEQRLRDFAETPKRLCYDEFHRTSSSKSVRGQLVRDVREGRKRGIQIVLASQMLHDFDDDMVDLATGVWILGSAISDTAVDETQRRFGLTDTARWIMRHRLTGPKASGAPCLFVLGTVDGKYEQFLINTLGPIELWAFSTSAEDVAIRNRLYNRLGAAQARKLLAAYYPGGSARSDIRRRVAVLAEKGENMDKASVGAIITQIADELTAIALDKFGGEAEAEDVEAAKKIEHKAPAPVAKPKEEKKPEEKEKSKGEGDKGGSNKGGSGGAGSSGGVKSLPANVTPAAATPTKVPSFATQPASLSPKVVAEPKPVSPAPVVEQPQPIMEEQPQAPQPIQSQQIIEPAFSAPIVEEPKPSLSLSEDIAPQIEPQVQPQTVEELQPQAPQQEPAPALSLSLETKTVEQPKPAVIEPQKPVAPVNPRAFDPRTLDPTPVQIKITPQPINVQPVAVAPQAQVQPVAPAPVAPQKPVLIIEEPKPAAPLTLQTSAEPQVAPQAPAPVQPQTTQEAPVVAPTSTEPETTQSDGNTTGGDGSNLF